jgi:hypothetical protein
MYGQIYAAIRDINRNRPEGKKLRVLLGDPPIDWSKVRTKEDILPFQSQRETHFAEVVIREVLDKNLKALVIIGGPHLDRSAALPMPKSDTNAPGAAPQSLPLTPVQNVGQIIESKYPGKTYVILVHTGFADDTCNAEVEGRMKDWKAPALTTVKGSWLETLDCAKFPPAIMINPGANAPANQLIGGPADGALPMKLPSAFASADAYLFVGMRDALTMSSFAPDIYLDTAFAAEQSRRHELMMGKPLDFDKLTRDNPKYYVDNFPR